MTTTIAEVLDRIRAEYREMPGMRLTAPQVQRLCGIDEAVCDVVLTTLVDVGFLQKDPNGTYGAVAPDRSSSRRSTSMRRSPALAADHSRGRGGKR